VDVDSRILRITTHSPLASFVFASYLEQIIRPIPKRVPVLFQVDSEAASASIRDDLSVFRVALSFVSIACARTEQGSIVLKIALDKDGNLVFECNDSSELLSVADQKALFGADKTNTLSDSRLMGYQSAASLLDSLGGTYDYRPPTSTTTTSVFWFSIPKPLIQPSAFPIRLLQSTVTPRQQQTCQEPKTRNHDKNGLLPLQRPPSLLLPAFKTYSQDPPSRIPRGGSLPCGLGLGGALLATMAKNNAPQKNATSLFGKPALPSPVMKTIQRNASFSPDKRRPSLAVTSQLTPQSSTTDSQKLASSPAEPSWKNQALVIDDSLVIRKGLSRLLSKNGYHVVTAENGQQGLEAMKANMFDFVLCDFLMPVMDGLDCVQQFRAWEKTHRPGGFYQCIFGISAHADTKDLEKGIQVGMDLYFTKPIPLKVIKEFPDAANGLRRMKNSGTGLSGALLQNLEKKVALQDSPQQDTGSGSSSASPLSCLVAKTITPSPTVKALEDSGWRCVKVDSSEDALLCLKQRNWDAVIIDSDLAPLGGVSTIATFREWEKTNRINRQSNVFLHCPCLHNTSDSDSDDSIGDTTSSSIQAPPGFDGVIQSERLLEDFRDQVKTENDRHSGIGSSLSILTH